jgi:glycosidase
MNRSLSMPRVGRSFLVASLMAGSALHAQAPTVDKVDPPNWWGNHSINPVRLLVHGANLGGARFLCPKLSCSKVSTNAAGTYAFVDVTIPKGAAAGSYPLTLRTAGGSARVPFTVSAPLANLGRFQGYGPDDVMYLIMPDRFANGDTTNDRPAGQADIIDRTKGRYYHGGDLAGVKQKLPYLKQLGITAIWFNPIYDNNNALNRKEVYDGQPITDYHGYGATDFYKVEEHFGSLAEFRSLVDDAHKLGIKIILDMVANHTGPYHPWVQDPPTPTWFHGTEASHPNNDWQTWTLADPNGTSAMRRNTLDGWFVNLLPDFNQDDPEVARYIIQNTLWWVGMSGMDGIRQDTWPYAPRTFWRDWMAAIKRQYPALKVVGEVLDGDPAMISFFEGSRVGFDGVKTGVDQLFDFPMHFTIRNVFGQGQSIRQIAQMLAHDQLYRDPTSLVTLLGLHDVKRFMSEKGATIDGLKLAYTLLFTIRGTPLIYYGDEIGLPGGDDPDNRRDFPGGWSSDARNAFEASGRTPEQQSVFTHVQALLKLRASRPELRGSKTAHLFANDQAFVYRRGATVIALNNSTAPVTVDVESAVAPTASLGSCAAPVKKGAVTAITIPARSGCVF